ncbi:MAG: hypothetical protein H7318_17245 [Oligoflexus sp.]|nr:hypothetical protein [Oligoflexus sp.]
MLKTFFRLNTLSLLAFLSWSFSVPPAQAAVGVGPKHVYILYPGVDTIWGSYIFVVANDGQAPEQLTFPVMLPKETVDFQAQDTLSPQELKLGKDGGITIDKSFPSGETLLQISFKLPAAQGSSTATITAPYPYQSVGVFVWQDSFTVNGPAGMEIQKGVNLSGKIFDTYSIGAGEIGKTLSYTFENVPEGRGRLWMVGGIFGGILLITGLTVAFYTRPKLLQNEEVL